MDAYRSQAVPTSHTGLPPPPAAHCPVLDGFFTPDTRSQGVTRPTATVYKSLKVYKPLASQTLKGQVGQQGRKGNGSRYRQ